MTEQTGEEDVGGFRRPGRSAIRPRWSVRGYLAATIAAVVVVFVVGGVVVGQLTMQTSRRNVRANADSLAGVAARAMASSMVGARTQVAAVAANLGVAGLLVDPSTCQLTLQLELLVNSRLDLIRPDGQVVCTSMEDRRPSGTHAEAPWLERLAAREASFLAGPFFDPRAEQSSFVIGAPVRDAAGGLVGGLVLVLPTEKVANRLAESYGGFRSYHFAIVDSADGAVVSASDGHAPTASALPLQGPAFLSGSAEIDGTTWEVLAGLPRSQALQPARTTLFRGLALAVAVLLVLLASLFFVFRRITRPLRQLTAAAGATGANADGLLASLDGPSEIGRLAQKLRASNAAQETHEVELSRQALHDPLTGLPNRALLAERLTHSLQQTARSRTSVTVMFLDLDRFKTINDALGHAAGDQVLVTSAIRLAGVLRPGDTLARFGGDEFVIVGEDLTNADGAQGFVHRIVAVVEAPIEVAETLVRVTASVGVARGTGAMSAEDLLRNADTAMYLAKNRGGARFEMFDAGLGQRATVRLKLENELRTALDRGELHLEYQPKVDLATRRTVGLEALLRWDHTTLGSVPPSTFIPVAEETGLIVPLGRYVIAEACQQSEAWRRAGIDVPVSVNVSARQLADSDFVGRVASELTRTGTAPSCLCIELTESILMYDATRAAQVLGQLHELGVVLSIDDFGRGYSSLAYLHRFPVDELKIDRLFVQGLTERPEQRPLVAAMVAMGRALELDIVAEGVESLEQAAQLRSLGCRTGQGFLFSAALPAASVGGFLKVQPRPEGRPATER